MPTTTTPVQNGTCSGCGWDCEMVHTECCDGERRECETYQQNDGCGATMTYCDDDFGCGPERVAEQDREMRAAYAEWAVSPQRYADEVREAVECGVLPQHYDIDALSI